MGQRASSWWKIFQLPAFLAANLAILLLVGISTARESYRGWTVEREIRALEAQAETLEGKKLQLMELTNALSETERVELEAKARLGWKREGERVVVLTGWQAATGTASGDTITMQASREPEHVSNPRQWIRYFFHPINTL